MTHFTHEKGESRKGGLGLDEAQSVRCLMHKLGDLSSNPQHPHKALSMVEHASFPVLWRAESGGSLGLVGSRYSHGGTLHVQRETSEK